MCGIAGIVYRDEPLGQSVIERMTFALSHRGPDDGRSTCLKGCDLGHRRLSIIDLSSGQQPMSDETSRYWISFNGEIYNYQELRRDLEQRGWEFRTQSDTEVLLRGYQAFGEQIVERLNGQFAFLIWDVETLTLFAARDRLGEKPLYYAYSTRGDLLFGSEIKALIASEQFTPKLDQSALEMYLSLLYVPPFRTIYENVFTLQPGYKLLWKKGSLTVSAYWQPNYDSQPTLDAEDAVSQLRILIERAVKRQMVADVPIGAFLSGGLDSSTIVALMSRHTELPIKTFSMGFGNLINELPYAREIANLYHTDHHEMQMDIPVGEMLECMAHVYDEPFADSSNIPTYLIAQFARQHVTVALSGDGGDELFGGYSWYQFLLDDMSLNPSAVHQRLVSLIALSLRILVKLKAPLQASRDNYLYKTHRMDLRVRYPDIWERHFAVMHYTQGSSTIDDALRSHYQSSSTAEMMDKATDFDLRCYLPGDILVKVDRATMAHGLESRAPFLDIELVNFVLQLPWTLRFRNGASKELLREAYGSLWTNSIRHRSKQGFGAPVAHWIKRPDVQPLVKRVCAPTSLLTHLIPSRVHHFQSSSSQEQWTLLCLGLWLEQHSETL